MLIYNPAFDLYHCIFRLIQLLSNLKTEYVDIDRLRIWDFYLVFPGEIDKIKFPFEISKAKKIFTKYNNPYDEIIDSKRIFDRMKPFQISAIRCLASYEIIDKKLLDENKVSKIIKELPSSLQDEFYEYSIMNENIIKLLTGPFYDIPLSGNNGLKYRTGLLEFKYDSV